MMHFRKNVELLYDLDGSEGGIALNLFQLLLMEQKNTGQASSSRYEILGTYNNRYLSEELCAANS